MPDDTTNLHNLGNADQSNNSSLDGEMLPDPLPADPFPLFRSWFDAAQKRKDQPNPNALTLASVDSVGQPSARIVLCKGIDTASGHIVFYTNERGRKGRELLATGRAAAVFHWDHQDRQVRIEGPVVRSPAAESDAYFASRAWLSRIGAWTSDQSEPIATRAALEAKLEATMHRFGLDPAFPPARDAVVNIPRPPHWGGFRLHAERIEFWCAGAGRLHDRAAWTRTLRPEPVGTPCSFVAATPWSATRLQP